MGLKDEIMIMLLMFSLLEYNDLIAVTHIITNFITAPSFLEAASRGALLSRKAKHDRLIRPKMVN
jgi:hypothetical protein